MTRTYFESFNRLDEDETEIKVEYSINAGCPATYDSPAESGEVEIVGAWIDDGTEAGILVKLTDAEDAKFRQWIAENHDHDDGPDPDDERDRQRDAKLTGESP
jgi:hypothetical protein